MKRVKRLSDHDVAEIVQFQQFLADKETMNPADLYRKYQEYCGLSDEELRRIVPSPEKPE